MKYNIIKFVRNTADAYSASVQATFDDLEKAKVNYHQSLAALHNASDVKTATVKIEDEFGHELAGYAEQVEHEVETEEAETE
jgi:C4-type Zn-finger protein